MPFATREQTRAHRREYGPKWIAKNPDAAREIVLRYRNANPEKQLLWSARGRARKRGLPCDIEIEDIVIPKVCPVLGIPIILNVGTNRKARNSPNAPSLDRIIPALGYVRGNVQVISWRANNLKRDGTLEEFRAIVRNLETALRE